AAGPEDDEEERTSISLGWLVHAALSLKARVVRLVTRRTKIQMQKSSLRQAPTPVVSSRDRFEPRVAEAADEEGEIEDEAEAAPAARKPARAKAPRRSSGGYQLPDLTLLAASRPSD